MPKKSLLSYLLSIIYILWFFILLFIHLPMAIIANLLGGHALQKAINSLCQTALSSLAILGTKTSFHGEENVPQTGPIIIVANHQSMYDIAAIELLFSKFRPVFVAKKELAKWIPAISYMVRNSGAVIIDRASAAKAIELIAQGTQTVQQEQRAMIIFPEGTRSRDGKLKKFKRRGLQTLIEQMPEATIIPVLIKNSWQLFCYNFFPIPLGVHQSFTVLPEFKKQDQTPKEITQSLEKLFQSELEDKIGK